MAFLLLSIATYYVAKEFIAFTYAIKATVPSGYAIPAFEKPITLANFNPNLQSTWSLTDNSGLADPNQLGGQMDGPGVLVGGYVTQVTLNTSSLISGQWRRCRF